MHIGRIVFILAFNPGLVGPSAPFDAYTASDAIAAVHLRAEATAIAANGGNTETFSGAVLEEERDGACHRIRTEGRDLAVELWVAEAPGPLGVLGTDRTTVYYGDHPESQAAAEAVAAKISEIDMGIRLWSVHVEHDPSLPSGCRYIRVGLGNIRGVLGAAAMGTDIWREYMALQMMDGIVDAVTIIEE
jgi:hypothetical protein